MNKNSEPIEISSVGVAGENSAPNSNFFILLELSETSRAGKLTLELQVDIDKATVADMTLSGRAINAFCTTWRKGLRRIWGIPIVQIVACCQL